MSFDDPTTIYCCDECGIDSKEAQEAIVMTGYCSESCYNTQFIGGGKVKEIEVCSSCNGEGYLYGFDGSDKGMCPCNKEIEDC